MAFKHPVTPIRNFSFEVFKTPETYYQDPFIIYRLEDKTARLGEKAGEFQVSIRQGSFGEDKLRAEIVWQRKRQYTNDENISTEIISWTPQGIWEMDLSLVVVDIVDLDLEGIETPKFTGVGSARHAEDKSKLLAFIRALPTQWITQIYDAVLEVNPKWDTKRN